jgi:hypothetical protein
MTMTAKPLLLLSLALAATVGAEAPKTVPVGSYSTLWTNSPFTSEPQIPRGPKEPDPLETYALCGVSPVSGGYRVTLLNRLNPEERIILPGNPSFRILGVRYDAANPLATTVSLSMDSKIGTISFDEKLLALKASAATPKPVPPQSLPVTEGQRAPRPRISTPGTP